MRILVKRKYWCYSIPKRREFYEDDPQNFKFSQFMYVIVLVCIWSRIPGTVPTHFNAAGIADSYGGKGILWIEVIVAAVILLLLSLIEKVPSIWNFPVAVTEENKERLYKIALVMLGAIKILTTGLFIDVGVSSLVTRFPVWPMYIMLGAMVIVIVVAVVQMIRAK